MTTKPMLIRSFEDAREFLDMEPKGGGVPQYCNGLNEWQDLEGLEGFRISTSGNATIRWRSLDDREDLRSELEATPWMSIRTIGCLHQFMMTRPRTDWVAAYKTIEEEGDGFDWVEIGNDDLHQFFSAVTDFDLAPFFRWQKRSDTKVDEAPEIPEDTVNAVPPESELPPPGFMIRHIGELSWEAVSEFKEDEIWTTRGSSITARTLKQYFEYLYPGQDPTFARRFSNWGKPNPVDK